MYLLRPARLCGRQPESYLPRHILISGMIFVSYLSDFSLVFSSGEKLPKVAGHNESDQVKNRPFERGCRWIKLIIPPLPEGGGGYTVLPLSVLPPVQDIFRRIFLSNCWWQKSDIWSQASYRYTILWVAFFGPIRFLLPVCRFCWFLYTFNIHLYMHIFRRIFLSNYWWQESDIWSQASYRYAILWEAFLEPSNFYFLFAEEWGYHKWTLAHSSSCIYRQCTYIVYVHVC